MGFNVYMTDEEFKAVSECIGMMGTALEAASDEYFKDTESLYNHARNFEDKCIKNKNISFNKLGYMQKLKRLNT